MPYFSDGISIYVEIKVPTGSVQHEADFYKKGFSYNHFLQKLWRHLLTRDISYEGTTVTFCTLFRQQKG